MPTALIGDVIASREIADRDRFQERLKSILDELNRDFEDELLGRLVVLRGDEIEALLIRPQRALNIMTRIEEALAPHKVTWGLGNGTLATDLALSSPALTTEMDGPCFHRAREAFELARTSELWAAARGFDARTDIEVTALLQLLQVIRWRWTERQTEIVRLARQRLQKEVAQLLDVNPSVVSESLKAAALPAVLAGEAAVRRWFELFSARETADVEGQGGQVPVGGSAS